MTLLAWLLACVAEEPTVRTEPSLAWPERVAAIEDARRAFAEHDAEPEEVRAWLLAAVTRELLPAWIGTPWDFHGTSDTPGEGAIACGHFVGTVLRDAGFRVDRLALGRLPSELIVDRFADPADKRRYRGRSAEDVVADLRTLPEGLYAVGLDHHAGLLVRDGGGIAFCNASPYAGVVCEDPVTSPAFVSDYRVVGPVLGDAAIERWLAGETIEIPGGW